MADRSRIDGESAARTPDPGRPAWSPRLRQRWDERRFSLFDLVVVVLAVLVLDVVVYIIGVFVTAFAAECGAFSCATLTAKLHLLRIGLWAILAIALLPLAIAFLRRRQRILVAIVQVVVCGSLLLSNLQQQDTLRGRINGTVPCWNPAYTPAECPWGQR